MTEEAGPDDFQGEAALEQMAAALIEGAGGDPQQILIGALRTFTAQFSGPLPPPQMLRGYEEIVPGAAERILGLTERESSHRHKMDVTFLRYRFSGLGAGVVVALAAIGAGTFLAFEGKNAVALAIILLDVAGVVGVLVTSRVLHRRNGPDG